jgi:hypothetical protein
MAGDAAQASSRAGACRISRSCDQGHSGGRGQRIAGGAADNAEEFGIQERDAVTFE